MAIRQRYWEETDYGKNADFLKIPMRLGFLPLSSPDNKYDQSLVEAFRQGYANWAWSKVEIYCSMSYGSVERGTDLLITCGSSASVAAKGQASTIPIVFLSVGDPIAMGLAESLSRPGRNITGFSDSLADLSGKLVDLASSFPQGSIDYFWYTAWPDGQNRYQTTEQAAQAVGIKLRSNGIAEIEQLDNALSAIRQSGSRMVIVQPSPFTYGQRGRIVASAMKNGLGTIFAFPVAAREGSLIGYGPDYIHSDLHRSYP